MIHYIIDYIERQEAISQFIDYDLNHKDTLSARKAIQILDNIPAVDMIPAKHGKWVLNKHGELVCSECQAVARIIQVSNLIDLNYADYDNSNFCPHCGAKMDAQGERRVGWQM